MYLIKKKKRESWKEKGIKARVVRTDSTAHGLQTHKQNLELGTVVLASVPVMLGT